MINWSLFSKAISAYEDLGYKLIEVPWQVDRKTIDITLPPGKIPATVSSGGDTNYLVGSAEQSFIYLALQGKLLPGKYQALTPCFRDDPEDEWHQKYFMKLELIHIDPKPYILNKADGHTYFGPIDRKSENEWFMSEGLDPIEDFEEPVTYGPIMSDAKHVLSNLTHKRIDVMSTDEGADLMIDGIEIGSYGIRTYNAITWVYGTGLAEPRFSKVNKL
jgi:hypothetical protein